MKPVIAFLVLFAVAAPALAQRAVLEQPTRTFESKETSLAPYFKDVDAGCFVLKTPDGRTIRYNPKRCAEPYSPCSTFKIPNSLIGLETGVIPDADHVIKWDGTEQDRKELNRDHTLRSAIKHSVVWYYQALATRVGPERMKAYLEKIPYGNRDMSDGLTTFWLGTSLKISADEQVEFLGRLMDGTLPFSERSMNIVQEILVQEEWPDVVYRGKTGSARGGDAGPDLGWYVGTVTRPDGVYLFAANISGKGTWGTRARAIVERILRDRGLLLPEEEGE